MLRIMVSHHQPLATQHAPYLRVKQFLRTFFHALLQRFVQPEQGLQALLQGAGGAAG